MSERRLNPRDPAFWTEERRQALRDLWTAERRLELALKRKERPLGNRDPAWWTPQRRQEHSQKALMRTRRGGLQSLEEAFDAVDRVREKLRNQPW